MVCVSLLLLFGYQPPFQASPTFFTLFPGERGFTVMAVLLVLF
jgi:hypothetical protein